MIPDQGQVPKLEWFKVECILSGNIIAIQEVEAEDKDKARDKFLTDLPKTLKFKVTKKN